MGRLLYFALPTITTRRNRFGLQAVALVSNHSAVAMFFLGIALFPICWSTSRFADAKGFPKSVGVLGIFGIFGLFVLLLLPSRVERIANDERGLQNYLSPCRLVTKRVHRDI